MLVAEASATFVAILARWIPTLLAVILLIGVGFAVVRAARRFQRNADDADNVPGFSLEDLRHMRDTGRLSKEEYEATRTRLIASMRAAAPAPTSDADRADPPFSGPRRGEDDASSRR